MRRAAAWAGFRLAIVAFALNSHVVGFAALLLIVGSLIL